jgi:hypothetical protein
MFVLILLDFLYDFCMFLVLGISFCNAVVQAKKSRNSKNQTKNKQIKSKKNLTKTITKLYIEIDEKMW